MRVKRKIKLTGINKLLDKLLHLCIMQPVRLMHKICFFLLCLFSLPVFAQVEEETDTVIAKFDSLVPDPKYREDQFYVSISYNLMQGKPPSYSQNSLSTGLTIGFLRDMPINEARTHSVAIGLGYSYNNIKHNLFVSEIDNNPVYNVVPEGSFDKNKLVLHYLELPIELRWRNSTQYSHKFWRVYAGFKVSYLMNDRSQFESSEGRVWVRRNPDINKFICGTYIAAGWNTWNFYAYYGITPIYGLDAENDKGVDIKLNSLNIGLMFYIL